MTDEARIYELAERRQPDRDEMAAYTEIGRAGIERCRHTLNNTQPRQPGDDADDEGGN